MYLKSSMLDTEGGVLHGELNFTAKVFFGG
jgi:hypothetical protein